MMLKKIENFHNRLSDTDFVWFPFLFLKLKPQQTLSQRHILKMTPCFAIYFVLGYVLKQVFGGEPLAISEVAFYFLVGHLAFYAWFNLVTAFFWNRRARRMQKM